MFGVKELRAEVERMTTRIASLEAQNRSLFDSVTKSHADLALLLAHLKLEINTVPTTPEKRVVEKAGTRAKRPKPAPHPSAEYATTTNRILDSPWTCWTYSHTINTKRTK